MHRSSRTASRHAHRVSDLLEQLSEQVPAATTSDHPIAESWSRAYSVHGLHPDQPFRPHYLSPAELRRRQEQFNALCRLARKETETLGRQLRSGAYSIFLADFRGCILHRTGERHLSRAFRRAGLATGADWSERAAGTNGIGTAITRREATLVHADEHFLADNGSLSCAAAPIRAGDGKLLAVLDASTLEPGLARKKSQRTMALVQMAARSIENGLLKENSRDHWIIAFHARPEFIGTLQQGLLAVDVNGRIRSVNASALAQLGVDSASEIVDQSLETLVGADLEQLLDLQGNDNGVRQGVFGNDPVLLQLSAPRVRANGPAVTPETKQDPLTELLAGPEPGLAEQIDRLRRLLNRDIPFFISGETGSGKEFLARAIHESSQRAGHPFVALNCAAIPAELIESELFGYQPGAFTGALRDGMVGKFMQADGGTLFLDEIGDMPTALQTRLLRALETGEITPLGGHAPQKVCFQLISASHQDLEKAIAEGLFREDLYYRINGFNVHLPALKDRRDLPGLIRRILLEEAKNAETVKLSSPAMDALIHYRWPGNLRQLRNALRVAIGLCDDGVIRLADLPAAIRKGLPEVETQSTLIEEIPERAEIIAALQRQRWNVRHTAVDLGISRNTLYRRMHRYKIPLQRQGR